MKHQRQAGFTLIELLVAMGLLGILLLALNSVESLTTTSSVKLTGQANRLRSLQDSVGYVGDRVRVARDLRTSVTVDGVSCTLTPAMGAYPCFAMLVTEAQQLGKVDQYDANTSLYLVYRFIPRSQLVAADKAPDSWADTNTLALVESRTVVCSPNPPALPCTRANPAPSGSVTMPDAVPASLNTSATNVIMDYGTLEGSGGSFTPFNYDSATGALKLAFRQKQLERGAVQYSPGGGPLEVTVQRRN
ncbi:hypothetical protein GCM10010840_16400 [Deinococcus aerolatus]|uniref:Prepilin-type N-terminal cleavage/methylation domain-containing protein n=1 Tax=Deinococcus aerolatus TaxID=522487 RepID=A0ABQ2G791_9DEIO|nr:prepilin-type N-terminal cleavage/methylation domain-containing protein [Deinococcus aerolatus]GGL79255.1 hypothetical protein GCM10010840_16400 [Deinococcus aerolatus]